jgi:hypothetical protein
MHEVIAFFFVSMLVVAIAVVAQRRVGEQLGQLVFLGLCLRIIGATLRYEVIERAYGGGSDAKQYFFFGKLYAERMANFDFGFFLADEEWGMPHWWGTQFIRSIAGVVVFVLGENLRAAFVLFSCCAFLGQYLVVEAFGNAYGQDRKVEFAKWAWFWPSLWFWPSSVGKEAVLTLGVGLFAYGYVGRKGKFDLKALAGGFFIAAAIRPHVAMLFGLSIAFAEFLRRKRVGPGRKLLSALLMLVVAAASVRVGLSQLGLADADLEGIEEFFEHRAVSTEQGGSRIYRATGVLAIPVAFVNVFFRPFPFEATGIQIFSSAEIWLFWYLVFRSRRGLRAGLKTWRENRFAGLALPVTLGLGFFYGLAFANLGIIARQRTLLLPFLLSLLAIPRGAVAPLVVQGNAMLVRAIRAGPNRGRTE